MSTSTHRPHPRSSQATVPGPIARHVVAGSLAVFDGGLEQAATICLDRMRAKLGARVATANLDFLALARRDASLRGLLRASHLVVADGWPVARMARMAGATQVERVAGVDLVARILERSSAASPTRVLLYGSEVAVAKRAIDTIHARYPGARVVQHVCPPFRPLAPDEVGRERDIIREANPDLVLVALGCPKQERLIAGYFDAAPHAVWVGVGGTLDFFAGRRRRAPAWAQRAGLEWVFRLAQEPRRLWRRYLLQDVPELARSTAEVLRMRRAQER